MKIQYLLTLLTYLSLYSALYAAPFVQGTYEESQCHDLSSNNPVEELANFVNSFGDNDETSLNKINQRQFERINEIRSAHELQKLINDPRLQKLAQNQCDYLASIEITPQNIAIHAHKDKDGRGSQERQNAEFKNPYQLSAENVAYYPKNSFRTNDRGQEAVDNLFFSEGHRRNMMHPKFPRGSVTQSFTPNNRPRPEDVKEDRPVAVEFMPPISRVGTATCRNSKGDTFFVQAFRSGKLNE